MDSSESISEWLHVYPAKMMTEQKSLEKEEQQSEKTEEVNNKMIAALQGL